MVIAMLVPTVTGVIYYSKPLLGKPWMKSIGMTEEKQKEGNMAMMMGVSIVLSFFVAFFMLFFCNQPGQEGEFDTFKHGAFHGAFIAIVFAMPIYIINGLFEQKKWSNMLINALYWIITLAIMGGILDVMNHFPNTMQEYMGN
jgi:hypothetical protein